MSFTEELVKASDSGIEATPDYTHLENLEVQKTLDKFLNLSVKWAISLEKLIDPLSVQTYEKPSDVPYKEVTGGQIATGSFGIVYKAESSKTGTIFAIKQLKGIFSPKRQDTVRKELSLLQICDHPNVVKLIDAYQIDDTPDTFYFVMSPWAPYTLATFLHQSNSRRLQECNWFMQGSAATERQVIRIFTGLADGLSYLHEKSIKHKDIKPENILFYNAGLGGVRPIIADLGISKIFIEGNPTDYNKSTYAYLAPEQVNATGSTFRSDVWQLGCCFALILAVFRAGSAGCRQLWNSFENSNTDCSCNIALESANFMKTFGELCGHGSISQLRAHWLTSAMLEMEPEQRFDIKTVKVELADLMSWIF